MQTTYRNAKTLHRLDVDIAKSGTQKYTRRNKLKKALWCMVELDLFADATDRQAGEGIRANLLHRLMVIFLEEISVCNLGLWLFLAEKFDFLFSAREKRKKKEPGTKSWNALREQEKEALVWIVTQMCRSRHVRILSHTRSAFGHGRSEESLQVSKEFYPEFYETISAFGEEEPRTEFRIHLEKEDDETNRLCSNFVSALENSKYSAFHWATKIFEKKKVKGKYYRSSKAEFLIFWILEKYFETKREEKFLLSVHKVALEWCKELSSLRESFLCWWCLVCACVIGWQERELADNVPDTVEVYARNDKEQPAMEMDSYVIDKHTKQGREGGADSEDFVFDGAFVVREAKIGHPKLRAFYEDVNVFRISGMKGVRRRRVAKESDLFDFVVKAQLVCGYGKTDTYFAVEKATGKRVFVKGPFKGKNSVENVLRLANIKKAFGLPSLSPKRLAMRPDFFPDAVMGLRAKMQDRNRISCFLVFPDETNEEILPTMLKKGNVTPETEVVDWSKVKSLEHFDFIGCENRDVCLDFCIAVMFRKVCGVSDLAQRNFLYVPRKTALYSIDEDICGREVDVEKELKKNRYAIYKRMCNEERPRLLEVLENWRSIISSDILKLPEELSKEFMLDKINSMF
ncbi:glycosyltransferase [Tokyovirus A1]|uniref:glycosyltransferase n=1 Tax=Tokyovirus A1 TaxID=1826170 RepID=UPI0007A986D6|nr:glycosyltransferase [Tokyovirus A1]BAU80199.1 glycosyltransferase [Tokyovirus A1]